MVEGRDPVSDREEIPELIPNSQTDDQLSLCSPPTNGFTTSATGPAGASTAHQNLTLFDRQVLRAQVEEEERQIEAVMGGVGG